MVGALVPNGESMARVVDGVGEVGNGLAKLPVQCQCQCQCQRLCSVRAPQRGVRLIILAAIRRKRADVHQKLRPGHVIVVARRGRTARHAKRAPVIRKKESRRTPINLPLLPPCLWQCQGLARSDTAMPASERRWLAITRSLWAQSLIKPGWRSGVRTACLASSTE